MYCRICGTSIDNFEEINDVEVNVNNLYEVYTNTPKVEVRIYYCPICRHIQMENMLSDTHYRDFNLMNLGKQSVQSGGNASKRIGYYREVLQRLRELGVDNKKILDIGCGHGTILKEASDFFETCVGVEPSNIECEIARENGCHVINAFFDESFSERDYSAFISTQVFEEQPNPVETIKMCEKILKEGGIGYIDIPNGQRIWQERSYYDIYVENINYFTVESLVKLINTTDLEIISIGEVLDGYHLAVYVRKRKRTGSFGDRKRYDADRLKYWLAQYDNVAIWGGGIKGRTFVQLLEKTGYNHVKHIFDSNEIMVGYYMGNCNIPIEVPTEDNLAQCDLVIVTALEYYGEIKNALREKYHYQGKVVSIKEL